MNKVKQYTKDDLYLPDVVVDAVDYARLEYDLAKWKALAEASQTIAEISQNSVKRITKLQMPAPAAHSETTVLPDGSAFAVMSLPLPTDHWLYAEREYADDAYEPKELPAPMLTHAVSETVVAAARYAIRGATNCGKEPDFDPDAMVQNFVYALCGSYGISGTLAPKVGK